MLLWPILVLLLKISSSESIDYLCCWVALIAEILSSICLEESKLLIKTSLLETWALLLFLNRGPEAFWTPGIPSAGGTLWALSSMSSCILSCGNSPAGSTTSYGFYWGAGWVKYFTPWIPAKIITASPQQQPTPSITTTPTISAIVVVDTPFLTTLVPLCWRYLAIERGSPKLGRVSTSACWSAGFAFLILPG